MLRNVCQALKCIGTGRGFGMFSLMRLAIVLFLLMAGASGCSSLRPQGIDIRHSGDLGQFQDKLRDSDERELELWKNGMRAFNSGDYITAGVIFESLSKSAVTEDMRLTALYALAAVRLNMARNQVEFKAGLDLLELWSQLSPTGIYDEDPRMLLPLLQRLAPAVPGGDDETPQGDAAHRLKPGEWRKTPPKGVVKVVREKDKECEAALRDREKEIKGLKRQIWVLRQQIDALETIHREIQEKKEQVSHP